MSSAQWIEAVNFQHCKQLGAGIGVAEYVRRGRRRQTKSTMGPFVQIVGVAGGVQHVGQVGQQDFWATELDRLVGEFDCFGVRSIKTGPVTGHFVQAGLVFANAIEDALKRAQGALISYEELRRIEAVISRVQGTIKKAAEPAPALLWLQEYGGYDREQFEISEISKLSSAVNKNISLERFEFINELLNNADLARMQPIAGITLARITFAVRRNLVDWLKFVIRLRATLESKQVGNADRLLKGLI